MRIRTYIIVRMKICSEIIKRTEWCFHVLALVKFRFPGLCDAARLASVARAPSNVSHQGQKEAIVGNGSPDRLALQAEASAILHARSNSTWSSAFVASAIQANTSTNVLKPEKNSTFFMHAAYAAFHSSFSLDRTGRPSAQRLLHSAPHSSSPSTPCPLSARKVRNRSRLRAEGSSWTRAESSAA